MKLEVGKTYIRHDFAFKSVITQITEGQVHYEAQNLSSGATPFSMRVSVGHFLRSYIEPTKLLESLF